MIELRETEIDALIRKGLLKSETRNNPTALCEALYAFLDSCGFLPDSNSRAKRANRPCDPRGI
jgi:hypothetical protein